jgi:hypothetical protein
MGVKDEGIRGVLEKLQDRYRMMHGNKFFQGYMSELDLNRSDLADIEELVNSNRYFDIQGYDLEKLYDQIYSYVGVLNRLEEEALPKMKNESHLRLSRLSDDDKIRFKMTVDSAQDNIRLAKDLLRELYENVKRVDLSVNGQKKMTIFSREHFKELEKLLLD